MRFKGALIKEQGVTFGIIIVKYHVLNNRSAVIEMMQFGTLIFGRIPIVLMAWNYQGIPEYQGRADIVRFLASIDYHQIPWKEYTLK